MELKNYRTGLVKQITIDGQTLVPGHVIDGRTISNFAVDSLTNPTAVMDLSDDVEPHVVQWTRYQPGQIRVILFDVPPPRSDEASGDSAGDSASDGAGDVAG